MLLQPQYNLLARNRFEVEYAPVFAQYGMGM
jgi:aryl-alcohol dehydrogenase-like predicted oxidoreductase